jgi:hypothetical protein
MVDRGTSGYFYIVSCSRASTSGSTCMPLGIWTSAFFLAQSQSPRLVHAIDAQMGSMQSAFLTVGLVGLGGAMMLHDIAFLLLERPMKKGGAAAPPFCVTN